MLYYRCKCGEHQAYGSMPPYACSKCEKCGSNLATSPDLHAAPLPHDFSAVDKVQTDQGEMTRTRCRHCHRTREQIEKMEAASP